MDLSLNHGSHFIFTKNWSGSFFLCFLLNSFSFHLKVCMCVIVTEILHVHVCVGHIDCLTACTFIQDILSFKPYEQITIQSNRSYVFFFCVYLFIRVFSCGECYFRSKISIYFMFCGLFDSFFFFLLFFWMNICNCVNLSSANAKRFRTMANQKQANKHKKPFI